MLTLFQRSGTRLLLAADEFQYGFNKPFNGVMKPLLSLVDSNLGWYLRLLICVLLCHSKYFWCLLLSCLFPVSFLSLFICVLTLWVWRSISILSLSSVTCLLLLISLCMCNTSLLMKLQAPPTLCSNLHQIDQFTDTVLVLWSNSSHVNIFLVCAWTESIQSSLPACSTIVLDQLSQPLHLSNKSSFLLFHLRESQFLVKLQHKLLQEQSGFNCG